MEEAVSHGVGKLWDSMEVGDEMRSRGTLIRLWLHQPDVRLQAEVEGSLMGQLGCGLKKKMGLKWPMEKVGFYLDFHLNKC